MWMQFWCHSPLFAANVSNLQNSAVRNYAWGANCRDHTVMTPAHFPQVLLFRVYFLMNVFFLQCRDFRMIYVLGRWQSWGLSSYLFIYIYRYLNCLKAIILFICEKYNHGVTWGHKVATTFTILDGFYLICGYMLEMCLVLFHEM